MFLFSSSNDEQIYRRDFPGGPVTKDLEPDSALPLLGTWVRPLVRSLDPIGWAAWPKNKNIKIKT